MSLLKWMLSLMAKKVRTPRVPRPVVVSPPPPPPTTDPAPTPTPTPDPVPTLPPPPVTTRSATSATLAAVFAACNPGDVVGLAAGSYGDVTFGIFNSGPSFSPPVTFVAADPANKPVFSSILVQNCTGLTFDNIVITYAEAASGFWAKSSDGGTCANITLRRATISGFGNGVLLREVTNVTIESNKVTGCANGIIHLNCSTLVIKSNRITDFGSDAMTGQSSFPLRIEGNYSATSHPVSGDHPDHIQVGGLGAHYTMSGVVITDNCCYRGSTSPIVDGLLLVPQGVFVVDGLYTSVSITNNLIIGAAANGCCLSGDTGGSVSGNAVYSYADQDSYIIAASCTGTTFTNNQALNKNLTSNTNVSFDASNTISAVMVIDPSVGATKAAAWLAAHPNVPA